MNRKMFLFLIFSVINTQLSAMWMYNRCNELWKAQRGSRVPACGGKNDQFDCRIDGKPLDAEQQAELHEKRKILYPGIHADNVGDAVAHSNCVGDTMADSFASWGHDRNEDESFNQQFGSKVGQEQGNVPKAYLDTIFEHCYRKYDTPRLQQISWDQAGHQACGQMKQQVLVVDITTTRTE